MKTFFYSIILIPLFGFSQVKINVDSLESIIANSTYDSVKIENLNRIGLSNSNNAYRLEALHKAKALAKKNNYQSQLAFAYYVLSNLQEIAGNRDSCYFYLKNMQASAKKSNNLILLGYFYNTMPYINFVYFKKDENSMAYYDSAVAVFEHEYKTKKIYGLQYSEALNRKIETYLNEVIT